MLAAPLDAETLDRAGLQAALRMALLRVAHLQVENDRLTTQLRNLADHDPLTDLLKPDSFAEALEAHLSIGSRYGRHASVVVLDLDGFSDLIESRGPVAADEALVVVADRLRDQLRETDVVARLGPDRFAALLTVVDPACCMAVVDQLLAEVRALIDAPDGTLQVTASAGLTDVRDSDSVSDLLGRAVSAIGEARAAGGDRVVDARPVELRG